MSDPQARHKPNPSFWLSLLFLAATVAGVVAAADWRWDTRLFPWAVGFPALLLILWQLVIDFRGRPSQAEPGREASMDVMDVPVDRSVPQDLVRRRTLGALTWIGGFTLAVWLLGFLLAIPIFVFAYLKREARAPLMVALALAACTFLFIWGIFELLMNLAWPAPALFALFR
jgi:hypothetical protein